MNFSNSEGFWFRNIILSIIAFIFMCSDNLVTCETPNHNGNFLKEHGRSRSTFVRSVFSLSSLTSHEMIIYRILKLYSYKSGLDNADRRMSQYFEDYEETSGVLAYLDEQVQEKTVADHPLLSFRMIYRFVVLLTPILKEITIPGILDVLSEIDIGSGWPRQKDLDDAMNSIIRIQFVYDLDISEFATGNVKGVDIEFGLRACHCHLIGDFALKIEYFATAVNWLAYAQTLVVVGYDDTVEPEVVMESLAQAISIHDEEFDLAHSSSPSFFTQKLNISYDSRETRRTHSSVFWKSERGPEFNEVNFWNLCSGEDLRTESEKAQLFCWYDRSTSPFLTISPVKVEQLTSTPFILQFYDIIPQSTIDVILKVSRKDLRNSPLYTGADDRKIWNTRTSAISWIRESLVPGLEHLPNLIEEITGLKLTTPNSSEMLHIASYNFGGHYSVHRDILEERLEDTWSGDRIATFMFYLSDVQLGGFTAFPQAGIAAKPIKASGILWYNMKSSGKTELNSYHGACPCILGNKVIGTKWIRSHDQFLTRPCSTNEFE